MKRCPECRRDYYDDSLSYCLEDGAVLLSGLPDEPATAILGGDLQSDEPSTRTFDRYVGAHESGQIQTARWPAGRGAAIIAACVLIVLLGIGGYVYFGRSSTDRIGSIAVLPFENRSGIADTDYLSDGLTDSLIFRFSQLPNLKVSPTSSVMRYKGSTEDIAQIARDLDVAAILSGRLVQVGDSLNISVQLIDARTNKLLWAEQYDRKMADLLATQREIATAITQKLQLKLSGDEKGIAKKYTSSNEAYQLYLKGRYYWSKRTKDDLFKSVESYKQAIDLDPSFALAYVGVAEAYNSMAKDPDVAPKDAVPFAKSAATKALEIDASLAEAHMAFGDALAIYDWNWPEAERELKKALELDPNISYIHLVYSGSYLGPVGRTDEALAEAQRAVELEPLSLINNSVLTNSYINSRQYDKAIEQGRKAYELDREFPLARHWLGMAYVATGRLDEAVSICRAASPDSPSWPLSVVALGHAYAKMGKRAEAEQQIAQLRDLAKSRYVRPYYVASIYAALGDKDKAFTELERSYQERDAYLGRINSDPFMDPLRDDPRFKDLLKRLGLEQ
ncbi:MAG TPA: tetratricopeptide repeat protein [Pyrinomonadaceae bacterium]|nr:tetratricopeptide repeat protein [Pyrinomonadaceae bacterium]